MVIYQGIKMEFAKAKGFFITGTDTEVGKTLVSGGIARILRDAGKKVGVFKPVASGCVRDYEGLVSQDAKFLRECSGCDFDLTFINPVGYSAPAAPAVCAEHENRRVDFELMAEAYGRICGESDLMIVEGVGGIRVPVSAGVDVAELAKGFGLPVVIVARTDLGTINHTLLTIDAVRAAGLELAGVVISGYDAEKAGLAQETLPMILEEWGQTPVLSIVPYDNESDVENGKLGELTIEALNDCDWAEMIQ